jgi:hypothetical protein
LEVPGDEATKGGSVSGFSGICGGSKSTVERTANSGTQVLGDVSVDHGGADIGVSQELLYGADVRPSFQ